MSFSAVREELSKADWWVAIFTGLLFAVTATLAWFTYRLWKETKHAVIDTAESRRPWLHFDLKPVSDLSTSTGVNLVDCKLTITNFGSSPAINVSIKSVLIPYESLTLYGDTPFNIDQSRFDEVESRFKDNKSATFNFFIFPNQEDKKIWGLESTLKEFIPVYETGIAFMFIYYRTPGTSTMYRTRRAYMVLPPEAPSAVHEANIARCIPCGEDAH